MFVSVIKFFLDPFNVLWVLAFSSFIAWYFEYRKLKKGLLYILIVLFLIVSTPLIPVIIINSLEDRYEPLAVEGLQDREAVYHIIVLGGGHGFDERLPANSLLSHNALGRLVEGMRLHRRLPNSKLVLSGSTSTPGKTTQAEMLQQTASMLGVEKNSILTQKEPVNTWQEAEIYAKHYGNTYPVILVTSATHMSRAMMSFKKFGVDPIPSPTNYRLLGSWKRKWLGMPSKSNIEHFHVGISSYAAMFYYEFIK